MAVTIELDNCILLEYSSLLHTDHMNEQNRCKQELCVSLLSHNT